MKWTWLWHIDILYKNDIINAKGERMYFYFKEPNETTWREIQLDDVLNAHDYGVAAMADADIDTYKNYFAVMHNPSIDWGEELVGFYTKAEVKRMIDQLTEIHNNMEETNVHPKDCEDIYSDFEFDE